MFQGLRPAAPIYILYKAEPRIAVGEVVSVSNPVPQYSATAYQNGMVMPPKAYVDIKIRIADEMVDLQRLPADATIADFGNSGMVVSESMMPSQTKYTGSRRRASGRWRRSRGTSTWLPSVT